MKTLDEVIETLERIFGYISDSTKNDALHYLKEYKIKRERIMAKAQDCEDAEKRLQNEIAVYKEILTDYVALKQYWAEQQENPPLTWDELRAMEGKPVWVEALLYKQWAVIAYIGEEYIKFEGANLYAPECRIYMGEDNGWQAYRKERHELDQKAH